MKTIASSLVHLVIEPRRKGAGPYPGLVLLHGRGADEHDLAGIAEELDERLLMLSVRAPHPFGYGGGFTWYDFDEAGTPDPPMFRSACDALLRFVREAAAGYPIDPAWLYLLGFSMGAAMGHALALTQPTLIRGLAACSGYVPEGTALTYRWKELGNLDVLIAHGTHDPILPVTMGRRARDLYAASPARLTYREYPAGHQIAPETTADIAEWFGESLGGIPGARS